jgi:hypothetical protein
VAQVVHEEFDGSMDPVVVDECIDQVAARFAGASIRSFVPLLVRRYVREELQARRGAIMPGSTHARAETRTPA